MGGLNTETTRFVDTWREKHTDEWILKAIDRAKEKGGRALRYINTILVGWSADGYPKSYDEQVKERKKTHSPTQGETPLERYARQQEAANGN